MARRALLIGINRYLIPGADLRGCVNDVKNIRAALLRYFDFRSSDIKMLTDLRATKKAMQSGIKALVSSGSKGDVLYLHYSGHGSNVPDKNGDEADHRDEILCPSDLDWKDPLTDDWLRTDVQQAASARQSHRGDGLLSLGHQHARDTATRCAGDSALPAQSLGPDGGGVASRSCAASFATQGRARHASALTWSKLRSARS